MAEVLRVGNENEGDRLDKFVSALHSSLSRSLAQRLIDEGMVLVEGHARKASYRLRPGEAVSVELPPPWPSPAMGEPIPLNILFEDASLLVVDKPAGMVVHPAAGHAKGTLVNAVLGHSPGMIVGNAERPGIVHRLDRDTSGLIVIAKTNEALKSLQRQFSKRSVNKVYLALVHGKVKVPEGRIEGPLARDPHDRKRFAVYASARAREAVTIFRLAERLEKFTLLTVEPLTGRTHQIRVHLAFIQHPVVGDRVYGRKGENDLGLTRQFLHAWKLEFVHPASGDVVRFTAPLPNELGEALRLAGGDPDVFK
jgi:23S rRNA pseudouridine1911/1915/1917 synthase